MCWTRILVLWTFTVIIGNCHRQLWSSKLLSYERSVVKTLNWTIHRHPTEVPWTPTNVFKYNQWICSPILVHAPHNVHMLCVVFSLQQLFTHYALLHICFSWRDNKYTGNVSTFQGFRTVTAHIISIGPQTWVSPIYQAPYAVMKLRFFRNHKHTQQLLPINNNHLYRSE